mgnify:FL=1
MRKKTLFIAGMMACCFVASAQEISRTGVADKGDGTYQNPVLYADYSDPDVCAAGDDFYMTASSFNCIPGLPILHSNDLVNWSLVNYALPVQEPQEFFDKAQHGKGVWAPAIRFHNGEFYIYWGDPDYGIYLIKAKDPKGEWTKPVLVKAGKGMIDPTPLWDEDGKVYLIHAYAGSRSGVNSILVICELNAEGTEVISDPVMVFDGNDGKNHTVEGPKLYKRNGYYYIFAPAGGVATGWQLVLRSGNIYGPYESKIVMAQGKTTVNGPHQGGWVDTNTGESWFVHFQDQGAYGRVIHLNPMKWINDWPVIGADKDMDGCGEPVTTYKKPNVGRTYPVATPPESDEFNTRHLGLQWQWHANKKDTYGFTTGLGYIRLYAGSLSKEFVNFWEVPNLLMQKFPAEEFTATAKLTFTAKQDGEQAGIIVMGWDYSYLSVRKAGDKFILQQAVCKDAEQQNPEQVKELASFPVEYLKMPGVADNEWKTVYLRVKVTKGAVCTFAYSLNGKKYTTVGDAFTARQGKWIGAKVGLFCVTPNDGNRGWADVDWFRMTNE